MSKNRTDGLATVLSMKLTGGFGASGIMALDRSQRLTVLVNAMEAGLELSNEGAWLIVWMGSLENPASPTPKDGEAPMRGVDKGACVIVDPMPPTSVFIVF